MVKIMNKYFKETITQKALAVKLSHAPFYENPSEGEAAPKQFFKNVCTPIPMPMNEELERVAGLLSIPKGRFLFLALTSALEEANVLLKEIDVSEYQREFNEAVEIELQAEVA